MKNAVLNLQNHFIKTVELKKPSASNSAMTVAEMILAEVMVFRRVPKSTGLCRDSDCQKCSSQHLPKILAAVKQNKPVVFVLPAFPGKSPNPEKVLGHLPDHAERLSLGFLGNLCQTIKKFYTPGIKIKLCSDGRVFSDVIGMQESHVSAYQIELDKLIKNMSLSDLSIFKLDDFYEGLNFIQMREELMKNYGTSLDVLKNNIRNGAKPGASPDEQDSNCMYRGITRFLFEDSQHSSQTKSRSAIQKASRSNAYEVIRRSNAWSELISTCFPRAVRLSIHPQTCGAKKLGIRLIGDEIWMTPWHGVAVESTSGYVLLKRSEAEARGAQLIYSSDGRPSHYKSILNQSVIDKRSVV